MKKQTLFLSIFLLIFSLGSITQIEASISHSIVPLIEELEETVPKKYSEIYREKVQKYLVRKEEKIRVVSYNILFNLFDHRVKNKAHLWESRLPKMVTSIKNMQPDILCLQEVYPDQLTDLANALEEYEHFIGESISGELNAIFYKKDRFVLDTKNYEINAQNLSSALLKMPLNPKDESIVSAMPNFLSPELEPGTHLTLAHFYDRHTEKDFVVLNTHLTFFRLNSRLDQAKWITSLVNGLHQLNQPVIFAGDLNTFPNRPDLVSLPFYDGSHICQTIKAVLKDSSEASLLGHLGPHSTCLKDFFTRGNLPFESHEDQSVILDHIFVSPSVTSLISATEPCQISEDFPSDHFPILADIILN